MTKAERALLEKARVGHLATSSSSGVPHCVPVCFALEEDGIWIALDEKPKSVPVRKLRRVRNLEENGRACLTVDHYEEDWSRLWFVMVEARAGVEPLPAAVVEALTRKYPQYRSMRIDQGIRLVEERTVSWKGRNGGDR